MPESTVLMMDLLFGINSTTLTEEEPDHLKEYLEETFYDIIKQQPNMTEQISEEDLAFEMIKKCDNAMDEPGLMKNTLEAIQESAADAMPPGFLENFMAMAEIVSQIDDPTDMQKWLPMLEKVEKMEKDLGSIMTNFEELLSDDKQES
jgi:hypothetical protein